MSTIRTLTLACLLMSTGILWSEPTGSPIRPLAQDFVVVGRSPDPQKIPLYSPTILRLDSGRLVAAYTFFDRNKGGTKEEVMLTSDDGGATWQERARLPRLQGRLFRAGDSLYYLATGRGLAIFRSDDDGESWGAASLLSDSEDTWNQTPANVWYANGNIYLAFERGTEKARDLNAWAPAEKGLVLLRAREGDDLTKPEAWTQSSMLVFADLIDGLRENNPDTDYFGVPFFAYDYPDRHPVGGGHSMSPPGWVEPNVVQITDPAHYWYDPMGKTFHILSRSHTGGTNLACLTKVTELPDGSMEMSLEKVPSGKSMLFVPVPGGHMRFHLLYDEQTKLYWLLGSQSTDSMTRAELLPPERYSLPNNERHRMVLYFSKNLVDWCFAGLVAMTDDPSQARHYASMDIDGEDLVILSRSGDAEAKSAHETNIITFHRVKNFRDLVY
ncbi:exo-alpha-sialidase [Ruficoccus amylovorans]|uniref:Exo-alpha-sialidase n=1 Tax=Ruficoccus amylovorans TaxID=1804625 RepID=A0A842HJA3_9BACT|nr:sialidase family protein [Ruficoccus amylovorans]MBC2595241.1 exo-alpha-sialidase [Ruficoccus amylovorans]